MLTCWRIRRRLAAWLDDELSITHRIAIDQHLGPCRSCASAATSGRAPSRGVRLVGGWLTDAVLVERLRAADDIVLSRVAAERGWRGPAACAGWRTTRI